MLGDVNHRSSQALHLPAQQRRLTLQPLPLVRGPGPLAAGDGVLALRRGDLLQEGLLAQLDVRGRLLELDTAPGEPLQTGLDLIELGAELTDLGLAAEQSDGCPARATGHPPVRPHGPAIERHEHVARQRFVRQPQLAPAYRR